MIKVTFRRDDDKGGYVWTMFDETHGKLREGTIFRKSGAKLKVLVETFLAAGVVSFELADEE